jgi:phytoene synthase
MKEESSQYCPTAEQRTLTMPMITLRSQGRSFYWAGKFLSADQVKQAAYLYTLCRHLDDIADEACDAHARAQADKQLKSLSQALTHAQPPNQALLRDIYTSARQLLGNDAVSASALQDLIATLRTDLRQVRIGSETELLQYCYGAAGTVGVMMSCLLNAQPRASALPHAIDLGIAMQMTNIARDVLTDAHLDRIYLPAENGMAGVHPRHIVSDDGSARHLAWLAVNDLLGKADIYYASAW